MGRFSENPDYREYERLLIEVHRLIAHGRGDSTDADALREQLEVPASGLNTDEIVRLDSLSADLYMLQDKEVPAPNFQQWSTDRLRAELKEAWEWNNWGMVLTVLRQNAARILTIAQIAYFRGRAYAELGHPAPALEFMRYAARLNHSFHYFELDLLRDSDPAQAIRIAQSDLESPHETVAVKSLAAGIVFQSTRGMPESESRVVYERIVSALRKVLGREPKMEPIPLAVRAHVFITLGLALDALGYSDQAMEAYDRAVQTEPNNDTVLVGRGIANWSRNPIVALADFQRAIAVGTTALIPHVALGLEAMRAGRYHQAAGIIDRIRQITTDPQALALAFEWAAIIASETGCPADDVRERFRIATELDPGNIRIQKNAEVFETRLRMVGQGSVPFSRWSIEGAMDLNDARTRISEKNRAPLAAIN